MFSFVWGGNSESKNRFFHFHVSSMFFTKPCGAEGTAGTLFSLFSFLFLTYLRVPPTAESSTSGFFFSLTFHGSPWRSLKPVGIFSQGTVVTPYNYRQKKQFCGTEENFSSIVFQVFCAVLLLLVEKKQRPVGGTHWVKKLKLTRLETAKTK